MAVLMVTGGLMAALPAVAAPTPQAEIVAFYEGFESAGLPDNWNVEDANSAGDLDYWGISGASASNGVGSAWVASVGSHTDSEVFFTDDFESGSLDPSWYVGDDNYEHDEDFWGISDVRTNDGSSYSVYCAQYGDNLELYYEWGDYQANTYWGLYDSYAEAYLYQDVSLSQYSTVMFEFWVYRDTEPDWDFFRPGYFDGGWVDLVPKQEDKDYAPGIDGSSGGWEFLSYEIPTTATGIGWYFTSDTYVVYEGVYVDDVSFTGYTTVDNVDSLLYDDGMDTLLTTSIDVSEFPSAQIQYDYWVDTQSGDYLEFVYFTDGWYAPNRHEGTSTGWATATFDLPVDTREIGFRFISDDTGRAGGAYVDEVYIRGIVDPPTCSAQLSETSGIERHTIFYFDGIGSGWRNSLNWSWELGDGTTSTLRSPSHIYTNPGVYVPSVTVTDLLGQSCSFEAGAITVNYDLSEVVVAPVGSDMVEGSSREYNAETRWGHQVDFEWRVDPSNCGEFTVGAGPRSTFTANPDQAGYTCTIVATYGGATGGVTVNILHDLSQVVVAPTSATVFASQRVILTSTDLFGHPFSVDWWATCGRVLPDHGPSTTFTAVATPGSTCIVTAEYGGARTTVPILVQQDPSNMTVTPSEIHLVEGTGVSFEAKDSFGKPLKVDWTVTPASCGELSITNGATTALQTSPDSGGTSCRVMGAFGGYSRNATVIVEHDLSGGAIELSSETVEGGGTVTASAFDKNHHEISADWSVSPGTCGELSPQSGETTTLTTSDDIGEVVCTLTAHKGTLTLLALVSIELGPPASIEVSFLGPAAEGGQTEARAQVRDAGGHDLDSSGVTWTTTCDSLSSTTGRTTLVRAPQNGFGSTCAVTATFGGISGTGDLIITRGPAARLEISPSNLQVGNGQRVEVSVKAWDQYDHEITPSTVIWAASCGSFEGEGTKVTYIAPASGGPCQISATVPGSGVGVSATQSVGVSGGLLMPLALLGVVAAAAIAGVVMMRRRKGGES